MLQPPMPSPEAPQPNTTPPLSETDLRAALAKIDGDISALEKEGTAIEQQIELKTKQQEKLDENTQDNDQLLVDLTNKNEEFQKVIDDPNASFLKQQEAQIELQSNNEFIAILNQQNIRC